EFRRRRRAAAGGAGACAALGPGGVSDAGPLRHPKPVAALPSLGTEFPVEWPASGDRAVLQACFNRYQERLERVLEKTDLIARLGPAFGLMGTLIPLGPGLAALGRGDVEALAAAVTVAFDTTVVGLICGSGAYVISRVRRRWYEADLNALELYLEEVLRRHGNLSPSAPAEGR
ncbi:MAG: MotA/TolQ/ExbB proton channel family protein, partial [Firmicutes bacterium]|nr:MotA/TolQ/ExbB proton channel family protein [Bacillota bacterium]